MRYYLRNGNAVFFLALGLLGGFFAAGLWPNTPLHAVATDKMESFSICTGHAEDNYEAIYFLDHLTGDLKAFVIGRTGRGFGVLSTGYANVLQDMKIDPAKNPKLLMVTGLCDLTRGGRGGNVVPSRSIVYVAEITSGQCGAYALPCNSNAHNSGQAQPLAQLVPITGFKFRDATAKGKSSDE